MDSHESYLSKNKWVSQSLYLYLKPNNRNQVIIIIIINLFIEGSLISAKALFCLRALFGATRIHSYARMSSLIRTQLSDLCMRREEGTFGEETFGYNCTQDENLPTCTPSGLEPPTYHILGLQHCSVHHGLNNSATKAGSLVHIFRKGSQKYGRPIDNITQNYQ